MDCGFEFYLARMFIPHPLNEKNNFTSNITKELKDVLTQSIIFFKKKTQSIIVGIQNSSELLKARLVRGNSVNIIF